MRGAAAAVASPRARDRRTEAIFSKNVPQCFSLTMANPPEPQSEADLHSWTAKFRGTMDQMRQQVLESRRREAELTRRLLEKDEQLAASMAELDAYKRKPTMVAANHIVLDPSLNVLVGYLRRQVREKDVKLERLKEELEAAQFSDNTSIGARLKAKCRMLMDENEELGLQLSEKRVEQAERALVAERKAVEDLKLLAEGWFVFSQFFFFRAQSHVLSAFTGDDMLTVALEEIDALQSQNIQLTEQLSALQKSGAVDEVVQDEESPRKRARQAGDDEDAVDSDHAADAADGDRKNEEN